MKTKTLLLTSVLSLVGGASLMAQTVYSQNAVGYINVPVVAGQFKLLSCQLTGATNNFNSILTNGVTDSSIAYVYSNGWLSSSFIDGVGWIPDRKVKQGEGIFYYAESSSTITFVGEVPQGTVTNHIEAGYNLRGSIIPQGGTLSSLGYDGGDSDIVYRYNGTWQSASYIDGVGWTPGPLAGPTLDVGEGFFYLRDAGNGPHDFVRTFTVN